MAALRSAPLHRRQFLRGIGLVACASVVSGLRGATLSSRPAGAADLILTNARIWTGDHRQRYASAIAVEGNRILAVGSVPGVHKYSTRATRVVDLQGRFVMPGFNDSHLHMTR